MKYWIIVEDRHAGPFTAQHLLDTGLQPDTLVWCEGLSDWTRADLIAELAEGLRVRAMTQQPRTYGNEPLAADEPEAAAPAPEPAEYREAYQQPVQQQPYDAQPVAAAMPVQQPVEPCPPAYIAWSIIATLLCCTIVGIPGIIFASMTKSAYYKGDIAKAKRYSELAQWFIIASIVLGAVTWPFQILFMGLFQ